MATTDRYWTTNLKMRRTERITRGFAYNACSRFKNYRSEFKKELWLEDHQVFRNERDAAIALTAALTALAKKRADEISVLLTRIEALIHTHDIADCPYLAPVRTP